MYLIMLRNQIKTLAFIQAGSLKWEIKCWKTEMNISNRKVSFGNVLKILKVSIILILSLEFKRKI